MFGDSRYEKSVKEQHILSVINKSLAPNERFATYSDYLLYVKREEAKVNPNGWIRPKAEKHDDTSEEKPKAWVKDKTETIEEICEKIRGK